MDSRFRGNDENLCVVLLTFIANQDGLYVLLSICWFVSMARQGSKTAPWWAQYMSGLDTVKRGGEDGEG
ncbi:hypothetical protein [Sterolibacterium denitrificans]|uniref:hypothetical protein n=1 Tax=Sterolibacterium denitrificans TaxID=157592 RepID=UPI0012B684E7|nr:hypothetical protein [Sterolibacterium denitrificans]